MRILAILLVALAALYATAILALAVFQRRLIYPGAFAAGRPVLDRVAPPGTEAITLTTEDGEHLYALWRAPRPGCGVVLSFHGNGSLPEPHATSRGTPTPNPTTPPTTARRDAPPDAALPFSDTDSPGIAVG